MQSHTPVYDWFIDSEKFYLCTKSLDAVSQMIAAQGASVLP